MSPLNEALIITVVGMVTVFFILFLIIFVGNLLIRFCNKYLPEEVRVKKSDKSDDRAPQIHRAIEAAIDVFTKGKGKVTNIRKL
ncbi:MAG: oxaloacetate decarboxylase subunit gamma [Bacteroidetes bacterium ADurb.Bin174]|jgi:oxaloacetate decarboxylase gamma subunit|nr:MAG: oxaloacetate decarboxylase subunit gamma [Bacteroidetes bacterium ADurb.Bin174]